MNITAYRDADDQIVFSVDDIITVLPSAAGDTPTHAALKAWLDGGGIIANAPPAKPPAQARADKVAAINAEAQRRIFLVAPDWKQRNLTARAVVLTRKIAGGGTLSADEQAEWDAGEAIWNEILAIRQASNALNAMATIPDDFAADTHWP